MSFFPGKIRETILRHGLLKGGERVLVGVSGGPDSMALLHGLWELRREWRLELCAAYLDHGLRAEAAVEQSFVRERAAALGLPFMTGKTEVRALREKTRLPLQEAAREARYDFFRKAAAEFSAGKVALGHTADDQAESVLMRLLRGAGTRGLAGIPPMRDERIIRPLIETWRREIDAYLEERRIPFRQDASNRSLRFLRNRIRHELIPILETYNPRIREILLKTADQFRQEEEWLRKIEVDNFSAVGQERENGGVEIKIPLLEDLPAALRLRIFRRAVETVAGHLRGFAFSHFLAIEKLSRNPKPHKKLRLPHGIGVSRSYGALIFSAGGESAAGFEHRVFGPGILEIPEIGRRLRFALGERTGGETFAGAPDVVLLEADRVGFPLTVRSYRPGDRFQPLGMKGEKKLKDFFIDRKIPLEQRRRIPLLYHEGQLLWVAGMRPDHRFRLRTESRRILRVEFI